VFTFIVSHHDHHHHHHRIPSPQKVGEANHSPKFMPYLLLLSNTIS